MPLTIRHANASDTPVIFKLIKALAVYEKMLDEVIATESSLHESLFIHKKAEVLLAEIDQKAIGFALYFENFSTFIGKPNMYLEDLYIDPKYRGHGYGKALLIKLASLAVERDYRRVDWSCLNWNDPAKTFYEKLGAKPMSTWTTYRLEGNALKALSHQQK